VLRLGNAANVRVGDDVLLAGVDALRGATVFRVARVVDIVADGKALLLGIDRPSEPFTLRPEAVEASVLLVNGEPVRFANALGLYVGWLACEEHVPLPSGCDEPRPADPCERDSRTENTSSCC
jgi:hypothetical protein